jgi:hypothetical protein
VPNRVLRLTFTYAGSRAKLVHQDPVEMVLPPSDRMTKEPTEGPFWFELRDANGEALYRKFLANPLDSWVEVPTGDHDRPFTHAKATRRQGTFVLDVPDVGEAPEVVMMGWAAGGRVDDAGERGTPQVLGRFPLKQALRDPHDETE